ncbi:MAG: hypothetical protein AAB819_00920 [Patescibacteria group bacterium]
MKYIFAFSIAVAALAASGVFAQVGSQVSFPIPELGNCVGEDECRAYCDESANADSCNAWARGRGIDVREAPPIPKEGGPGGCAAPEECRSYCDNPEHKNKCIDFSVSRGFMTPEEGERAKNAPSQGGGGERPKEGPGGCNGKESCDAFCRVPENKETCVSFAVEHGFMTAEDAARIRAFAGDRQFAAPRPHPPRPPERMGKPKIDEEKAKAILETQGGPGGCATPDECRAYCDESANRRACMNFARDHALIAPEEEDKFEKLLDAEGPGGCKGEECEAYCEAEGHEEECLLFARQHDLIGEEEYAEVKKFLKASKDGGPGGCRGRACEEYCADPAHGDECFAFAKKHNLIPSEEIERAENTRSLMEAGGPGGCREEKECHTYCNDPAHFAECSSFGARAGIIDETRARETAEQFKVFGEKFEGEFKRGFPPSDAFPNRSGEFPGRGDFNQGRPPSGFSMPPGVCNSPESCMKFCAEHPEADFCRDARNTFEKTNTNARERELSPDDAQRFMPDGGTRIPPEGLRPPEGFRTIDGSGTPGYPPRDTMPPQGYGSTPPAGYGGFERPPEGFLPPQGFVSPEGAIYQPPQGGGIPSPYEPVPIQTESPTSVLPFGSFVAGVLQAFLGMF